MAKRCLLGTAFSFVFFLSKLLSIHGYLSLIERTWKIWEIWKKIQKISAQILAFGMENKASEKFILTEHIKYFERTDQL